jgi:hypothetical protein
MLTTAGNQDGSMAREKKFLVAVQVARVVRRVVRVVDAARSRGGACDMWCWAPRIWYVICDIGCNEKIDVNGRRTS